MIDLRKFAAVSEKLSVPFGIEGAACAAELRALADKFERRELIPQGAMVLSEQMLDDFAMDTLVIQFAPRKAGWIAPDVMSKAVEDLTALAATGVLTPAE